MKHFYAIYDKVAERYNLVMEQPSDVQAMRTLAMEARNPNSFIKNFIDDYDLYKIATYNEENGKFENIEPPKLLAHATRYKEEN